MGAEVALAVDSAFRVREMSEILVKFDEPISTPDGRKFFAQAAGKEADGGLWEGWLEFLPADDSSEAVCSERETTQPNRKNVEYWAQGLTKVYLEGALNRALEPAGVARQSNGFQRESSRFSAPRQISRAPLSNATGRRPILDPFAVYAQGEQILRSELGALSRDQVEIIATAYGFTPPAAGGTRNDLVETVVEGVRSAEAR
jgi:hypothetical protein